MVRLKILGAKLVKLIKIDKNNNECNYLKKVGGNENGPEKLG